MVDAGHWPLATDGAPVAPDEPALREVLTYWMSRRPGVAPPTADSIDPIDIKPHLGRLAVVEVAENLEHFRTRLFGTLLVEEFQQERTGLRFGDLRGVENWEAVYAPYLAVRDTARPHYQRKRTVSGLRYYRGYARLLLPLSSDGVTVDRILAVFDFFLLTP